MLAILLAGQSTCTVLGDFLHYDAQSESEDRKAQAPALARSIRAMKLSTEYSALIARESSGLRFLVRDGTWLWMLERNGPGVASPSRTVPTLRIPAASKSGARRGRARRRGAGGCLLAGSEYGVRGRAVGPKRKKPVAGSLSLQLGLAAAAFNGEGPDADTAHPGDKNHGDPEHAARQFDGPRVRHVPFLPRLTLRRRHCAAAPSPSRCRAGAPAGRVTTAEMFASTAALLCMCGCVLRSRISPVSAQFLFLCNCLTNTFCDNVLLRKRREYSF
jgi:hypothetical protein